MSSINNISKSVTSILSNLNNFHSLEVVDCVSGTQLQVSENCLRCDLNNNATECIYPHEKTLTDNVLTNLLWIFNSVQYIKHRHKQVKIRYKVGNESDSSWRYILKSQRSPAILQYVWQTNNDDVFTILRWCLGKIVKKLDCLHLYWVSGTLYFLIKYNGRGF